MPFTDVIGHDRLIGILARSLRDGRLPPSLIFAGLSGIGKRLTALATAQVFNCTTPETERRGGPTRRARPSRGGGSSERRAGLAGSEGSVPNKPRAEGDAVPIREDSCGVCSTCVRIAKGVHPDVIVIEPGDSGAIKIDQVRECIDRAAYRPFEGRRRVVIIDNADAMMATAQQALLKTLEEPPSASTFILVTARPDVLLPTVLSRCPRLAFRPLSLGALVRALMARGIAEQEAHALAASAEGSLGRALELSAGDLIEARALAQQVLAGAARSSEPARRLDAARAWLGTTAGGGALERSRMAAHLRAMASLLRDAELLAAGGNADALANVDVRAELEGLAQVYRGDRGIRAFAAVDSALVALERNAGVKIVADWLVLQL